MLIETCRTVRPWVPNPMYNTPWARCLTTITPNCRFVMGLRSIFLREFTITRAPDNLVLLSPYSVPNRDGTRDPLVRLILCSAKVRCYSSMLSPCSPLHYPRQGTHQRARLSFKLQGLQLRLCYSSFQTSTRWWQSSGILYCRASQRSAGCAMLPCASQPRCELPVQT